MALIVDQLFLFSFFCSLDHKFLTSFGPRFCHDVFEREYKATIGVDFEVEKFSVLSVPVTLQV